MCRVLNFIRNRILTGDWRWNNLYLQITYTYIYLPTFSNYTIRLWAKKKLNENIDQSKLLFLDLFSNFSSYDIKTIKHCWENDQRRNGHFVFHKLKLLLWLTWVDHKIHFPLNQTEAIWNLNIWGLSYCRSIDMLSHRQTPKYN